ncbi:MAG: DUF2975 domain-containing protein [Candidatus Didemnitutus sp.]|nr:DUF2975 domain-containing protein [Candidatus Didemnitutus sp.]
MNRHLALLAQVFVVLWGLVTLVFLLGEPHLEGRNAHATTFQIYFHDPFLAYVYAGSLPFFVVLHRAFGLFGEVRRTGAFSSATVDSLRVVHRCALILLGFVAGGLVIVLLFGDREDRPAGVFMGALVAFTAGSSAAAATWFSRRLQRALA